VLDGFRIESVVGPASVSVFSALHEQVCSAQNPDVMARHALRDTQEVFEVTDAELALGKQPNDAQTGWVSKYLQQLRQLPELWLSRRYSG
jgi:hypothetical protein